MSTDKKRWKNKTSLMFKMNKKTTEKILKYFVYLFWTFLIILLIKDLFTFPFRAVVWFISLVILVIFYTKFGQKSLYNYSLLILIALLNILGEVGFAFFYHTTFYDKILHFIDPILICFFVYNISKNKFQNKKILILFCMAATISLSALWEIFEYLIDTYFGGYMQGVYITGGQDFFGLILQLR